MISLRRGVHDLKGLPFLMSHYAHHLEVHAPWPISSRNVGDPFPNLAGKRVSNTGLEVPKKIHRYLRLGFNI